MSAIRDISAPLASLAIVAELAGSIGLIVGCLSRVAAFAIATNMVVAIFKVHLANGFFMNWYGNQKGEGIVSAACHAPGPAARIHTQ